MKAKNPQTEVPCQASMPAAINEAMETVRQHHVLVEAITRQRADKASADARSKQLTEQIESEEIALALALDAPEQDAKRVRLEAHHDELARLIETKARATKIVAVLEERSASIDSAVAMATENLLAYATQLAAEQHAAVSDEIRSAAQALAVAIGKARGVGVQGIRPFEGYLTVISVPDPLNFRYTYSDGGWSAQGASLLDGIQPAVSEATSAMASVWQPLADTFGALKSCKPVSPELTAMEPYVKRGYSMEGVTNPPVYVEEEPVLQGFAAYYARGPQHYEIKGDASGMRTRKAQELCSAGEINQVGVATRDWVEKVNGEQTSP